MVEKGKNAGVFNGPLVYNFNTISIPTDLRYFTFLKNSFYKLTIKQSFQTKVYSTFCYKNVAGRQETSNTVKIHTERQPRVACTRELPDEYG